MPQHTKTSLSTKIALIIVSVAITFLCLEIMSRILLNAPPSITIDNLNTPGEENFTSHQNFSVENGKIISQGFPDWGLYIYTPTGTRLKKNVKAIVRNHGLSNQDIEINTNAQGFRHPPLGKKKITDFRILVLGDSITLGDFVPFDQTYPSAIQATMHPRVRKFGKDVDVINAGVGSIDLQNQFAILMEEGFSIKPDLVVVGLYLNDAHHSPTLKITRLPAAVRSSHLLRTVFHKIDKIKTRFALQQWERSLPHNREEERILFEQRNTAATEEGLFTPEGVNRIIINNFHDWGYAWSDGYWDKVLPLLEMMHTVCQDKGIAFAVVLFPVRQQVQAPHLDERPQQRFLKEMQARNIPAFNLLTPLRDQYLKDGINRYFDHCHYRAQGNKLVGNSIGAFLLREVISKR